MNQPTIDRALVELRAAQLLERGNAKPLAICSAIDVVLETLAEIQEHYEAEAERKEGRAAD